jgi:hypothetical protein
MGKKKRKEKNCHKKLLTNSLQNVVLQGSFTRFISL